MARDMQSTWVKPTSALTPEVLVSKRPSGTRLGWSFSVCSEPFHSGTHDCCTEGARGQGPRGTTPSVHIQALAPHKTPHCLVFPDPRWVHGHIREPLGFRVLI